MLSALLVVAHQNSPAQTNGTVRFERSTLWAEEPSPPLSSGNNTIGLSWADLRTAASVRVQVTGGQALPGVDFSIDGPIFTANAGDQYSYIRVHAFGDGQSEGQETFELTLTDPTGGVVIGWPNQVTGFVGDNPSARSFNFSTYGYLTQAVWRSSQKATLEVERSGERTDSADVSYRIEPESTQPGADYQPTNGTLHFAPNESWKTIEVRIPTNNLPDQNFRAVLMNPSADYILGFPREITVRVLNDGPGFSLQPRFGTNGVYELPENAGEARVDVVILGDAPARPVSVEYRIEPISATPTEDYIPVKGTLTFADGETRKTLAIPIVNDARPEGWYSSYADTPQSFRLVLENPTGGLPLGRPREVDISIRDNDPGYQVWPRPGRFDWERPAVFDEKAGTASVTLRRAGDFNFPSTVHYRVTTNSVSFGTGSAIAGVDFLPTEGILSFDAGITEQTFSITLLDDSLIEGDETFFILLDEVTGGVPLYTPEVGVMIRDGQRNPVRVDPDFEPGWPVGDALPVVQPADGKIILATPSARVNGEDGALLLRLMPDGSLDPEWKVAAISGTLHFLQLGADGRVLVSASESASLDWRFDTNSEFRVNGVLRHHLAWLNVDGSLDTTFSAALPASSVLNGLAMQENGLLLASVRTNGTSGCVMYRLNPAGTLDPGFKPATVGYSVSEPNLIFPAPDGKVFVTGYDGGDDAICLNPDGSENLEFQLPPNTQCWLKAVQPDGRLLALLRSDDVYTDPNLVRLMANGALDPSFAPSPASFSSLATVLPAAKGILWFLTTAPGGLPNLLLKRLNADGSADPRWPVTQLRGDTILPGYRNELLALPSGDLVLAQGVPGLFNGQPRAGLARLLVTAPWPRFEVDASTARVAENSGKALIKLVRCGTNTEPITVTWRTEGGTAKPGVDYMAARGTLTFPAGESIVTFELELLDNLVPDRDRTVRLRLQGTPPENQEYPVVEITIANDDLGFPSDGIKHLSNGRILLSPSGLLVPPPPSYASFDDFEWVTLQVTESFGDWQDSADSLSLKGPELIIEPARTDRAQFYRLIQR